MKRFADSGLTLLNLHFAHLNPQLFIHDSENCNFDYFIRYSGRAIHKSTLYLVYPETDGYQMFKIPGKYLVVSDDPKNVQAALGPKSNALVVSEADEVSLFADMDKFILGCKDIPFLSSCIPKIILSNNKLEQFVTEASKLKPCIISIYNPDFKQIFTTSTSIRTQFHTVPAKEELLFAQTLKSLSYPVLLTDHSGNTHLFATVYNKQNTYCRYVIEATRLSEEIDDSYLPFFSVLCWTITGLLPSVKSRNASETLPGLFSSIIEDETPDEASYIRTAKNLNFRLKPYSRLVLTAFHSQKLTFHHLMELCIAASQSEGILTLPYNNMLLTVLDEEAYCMQMQDTLFSLFNRNDCEISLGISFEFSDISELKRAYRQCLTAISLAPRNQIADYKYYFMEDYLTKADRISVPLYPKAMEIITYDKENHTDYAPSICAYLYHYKSTAQAALELHVHRNTLIYRINRCFELFHLDREDSYAMNNLMLSLKVLMYT